AADGRAHVRDEPRLDLQRLLVVLPLARDLRQQPAAEQRGDHGDEQWIREPRADLAAPGNPALGLPCACVLRCGLLRGLERSGSERSIATRQPYSRSVSWEDSAAVPPLRSSSHALRSPSRWAAPVMPRWSCPRTASGRNSSG